MLNKKIDFIHPFRNNNANSNNNDDHKNDDNKINNNDYKNIRTYIKLKRTLYYYVIC